MIGISTPTSTKLIKRRSKQEKVVYKLTKTALMKFRPQRLSKTQEPASNGLFQRLKTFTNFVSFRGASEKQVVRDTSKEKVAGDSSKTSGFDQLSYLFILDVDSYLVGNKNQLDAISINIVEDYIEADHLWTFKLKSPILHLLVDSKRKSIVAVLTGQILLFGYESRKSKNPPQLLKEFKLLDPVKMILFAKDCLLAVFFEHYASFYSIDGASSRQFSKKEYKVSKGLTLYRSTLCVEGILNLFFTQPKQNTQKPLFTLWCVQIDLSGTNCEISQAKSVYDVEQRFYQSLKVQGITKDCFLMNSGKQIYMFKKGYCVDKVAVNFHDNNTVLKYFSDKKLVHVAPNQIDFYSVIIDQAINPPKIQLKSTDSIIIPPRIGKYQFVDVLRFQEHIMGFFYQIPAPNLTGEVKYEFVLTLPWNYDEKVNSLLPKVSSFKGERSNENPQFLSFIELIEQRCDSVSKMGMTRKQAYLHIWRESGKNSVEEFKFLLDTLDYLTIREEITLKLKSKSMILSEVHKVQQGCLGMLSDSLFSQANFSAQGFKNYLISHLLIRKLEMLKEIKLYQKKAGKIKQADSLRQGDKLMVNIQQYTNTIQLDIKGHLLELIYDFCKNDKDLVTEIRIIIKKFKFPLRHIYQSFLKEIVGLVKEKLYQLLIKIPQLLPYEPLLEQQTDESPPLHGVWGQLTDKQWQQALYLGQVQTVFNRNMVHQFSLNVWTKRNWLTSHDMIFLSRAEIESQYLLARQSIFYGLLQHIFDNFVNQEKLRVLVNHIQDFYLNFPGHLYNNVFLYRKLYQYFKTNNFLSQSFCQFLQRKDEQIFKRIFDHQKHKKGSLLKQVKPIYEQLHQGEKFNNSLLKFFSSNLSQVSDIKYLLNRINNEKRQFHAQNEQMYEVLIKGMQIKLKLGSQKDIPIEQVLIYINKIPIQDNKLILRDLYVLQKLNEKEIGGLFKQMKINMSIFEIIRNRDTVLVKLVQHEIRKANLSAQLNQETLIKFSQRMMSLLHQVRLKVYGQFNDNDLMFIYLAVLVQNVATVSYIHKIIETLNTKSRVSFSKNQLQAIVYYSYRKKTCEKPRYVDNEGYLSQIISLLEQGSTLKSFILAQLELARMFTTAGLQMVYPICGQTGFISKRIIQGLLDSLSTQGLLSLDMQKLNSLQMQLLKCLGTTEGHLSLYELYEKQIVCLINKKCLRQALQKIQILFKVDPANPDNIIYPILMFRQISCEFIEQNKQLILSLISRLFNHPDQLLSIFNELISNSYSNDQQKQLLIGKINSAVSLAGTRFNPQNILFDDVFKEYLKEKPQKCQETQELLQKQFIHFINSNFNQYNKSIDLPIIHLIALERPELLPKYIHKSINLINLRELRCYLSFLSKYQLFDCFKVLQFGKRIFKVLYICERDSVNLGQLVKQNFAIPLGQIDNLSFLPGDTQNLNMLSKCVQKFRSKLKLKLNSSSMLKKKRGSTIELSLDQKFSKFGLLLSDSSIYLTNSDYPFNDSDKQIERQEIISIVPYKQPKLKQGIFDFKKYLLWMLKRTNQTIEYYLIKANESQVDLQMMLRQEALKMSFCQYSSDKNMRENAPLILGVLQKNQKGESQPESSKKELASEGMKNLPYISAIPNVQVSSISEIEFAPVEIQQIQQVILGTSLLKDEILSSISRTQEGKLTFNADLIRNYGSSQHLEHVIPEVLKEIYHDEKTELETVLDLFSEMQIKFSKYTQLNSDFLQIYKKIDHLSRKVQLQVPVRLLLPFEGLCLRENDSSVLFQFIKEGICKQLTQTNIMTISKIVALAFKRQDLNFQQVLKSEFMKSSNIAI